MPNKQLELTRTKESLWKKAGRFVAPLAVVGIMAMPGNAAAENKSEKRALPAQCKKAPKKKCELKVKKGDVISIEPVTGTGSRFRFRVDDVNAKGARFDMNGIIMSVTYGTKSGFVYRKTPIIFTVERTKDPKVAKLIWE